MSLVSFYLYTYFAKMYANVFLKIAKSKVNNYNYNKTENEFSYNFF